MKNTDKILDLIQSKGRMTSQELSLVLGVSRQYATLMFASLVFGKKILKLGKTRTAFYSSLEYAKNNPDIFPTSFTKRYVNIGLEEHKVLMDLEEDFPLLAHLPENIKSIFTFAFSEMYNNAIEHSESKYITLNITLHKKVLSFSIDDFGIGAFKNIMRKRNLNSEVEAIQDLLKGKITTMPKSHSGEGIFFSSRAAEIFVLDSYGYQLIVRPLVDDTRIVSVSRKKRGTRVHFEISTDSELHLNSVFKKYTNIGSESDYGFDKTEIRVALFTAGGVHISRSQARRILSGLEKFKIILLDFAQVPVVGQAFADEIYRVFQNTHPNLILQEENMSEGVRFMIERAKNEAKIGRI